MEEAESRVSATTREIVLGRIRTAIGRTADEDERARERVAARLRSAEANLIPERGKGDDEHRVTVFAEKAQAVQASVERLSHWRDIAGAVTAYLRRLNLPQKLVIAPDPLLDGAGFDGQPLLRTRPGTAADDDAVGLTIAEAGVAETGTLLLASSATRPTLLAFLPETSIVVLEASRVVASYEEALELYSRDADAPPRSLNFITGPSRTGDIGQKLELGAHGPKRLLILLVDESPSN